MIEDAIKVVAKINIMVHSKIRAVRVEETSLEAEGDREIRVEDLVGSKMLRITKSAGHVVRKVTCRVIVQKES